MRKVIEWLVINAFFVLIGLAAAGVMLILGRPLVSLFPGARDEWLPGLIIGLLAIAAALGCAFGVMRFISRKPGQRRGRDPA